MSKVKKKNNYYFDGLRYMKAEGRKFYKKISNKRVRKFNLNEID